MGHPIGFVYPEKIEQHLSIEEVKEIIKMNKKISSESVIFESETIAELINIFGGT